MFASMVRRLQDDVPRLRTTMEQRAEMFVAKAAMDVEREMKTRVPVDTGFLKNSIQAARTGPAQWTVTVGAEYGLFIDWGTARMPARPFVAPSVAAVSPNFLAAMRTLVAT